MGFQNISQRHHARCVVHRRLPQPPTTANNALRLHFVTKLKHSTGIQFSFQNETRALHYSRRALLNDSEKSNLLALVAGPDETMCNIHTFHGQLIIAGTKNGIGNEIWCGRSGPFFIGGATVLAVSEPPEFRMFHDRRCNLLLFG